MPLYFARTLQTEFPKVRLHQETSSCRTTWRLHYKCQKCNDDIIPFSIEGNSTRRSFIDLFNFDASNNNSFIIIMRIHEKFPTPFIITFPFRALICIFHKLQYLILKVMHTISKYIPSSWNLRLTHSTLPHNMVPIVIPFFLDKCSNSDSLLDHNYITSLLFPKIHKTPIKKTLLVLARASTLSPSPSFHHVFIHKITIFSP